MLTPINKILQGYRVKMYQKENKSSYYSLHLLAYFKINIEEERANEKHIYK